MLSTRNNHADIRQAGFSLLELLVVVVIIGILTTMFTLSVGIVGNDEELETAAKRLNAHIGLAREEAILQGREYGLRFYPDSYEFSIYREPFEDVTQSTDPQNDGAEPIDISRWIILTGDLLNTHSLPRGVEPALEIDGNEVILKYKENDEAQSGEDAEEDINEDDEYRPQIYLLSSGDMSPFSVELRREFTNDGILLEFDEFGLVVPETDDPDER
ncbi:MAG: type II secretion system minor pseudopilin GspH [Gammaproteobacteria bacterium]|nr:type II secretion system minor pseudopilin GspH [Gammaproteobacteria bacterium]